MRTTLIVVILGIPAGYGLAALLALALASN